MKTATRGIRMRHSLRFRLVIVVGTLLAVALAVTGVASTIIMQRNLTSQLGDSLFVASDAATGSIFDRVTTPDQLSSPDTLLSYLYLLGPNSYQVLVSQDGTVLSSALLTDDYELSRLTSAQQAAVVELAGGYDDLASGTIAGIGSVVSVASPFTLEGVDGTFTLINGASTAGIDATLREFVTTGIVIGLLALAIASLTGWWIIRRSLTPLERVVELADEVVATPLSVGRVTLPARSSISAESSSEAGRVSTALTRLLDHVEQALNVRHQAEESIRRFSADASHELKNPLASIRGYAEHYRHAPELTATTRDALERINSEAIRMSQLVSDLLLLTKVNASPLLDAQEVDLSRVVLEVVSDTRIAFTDHRWRIEIPDEPVVVTSDESALRQVLLNLTSNAGAHTPTGTTVTVRLVTRPDSVDIAVHDNGPGISPEALTQIFEPFAQNSDSTNRRSTGSVGLGLTIARGLSEWLGGTLSATSDETGSEFLVTIPR